MSPGKDPLDALLEEVARQAELVRESVEEMYDNAFIETNKSWVLPFLGTLVLAGSGSHRPQTQATETPQSGGIGDVPGERSSVIAAAHARHCQPDEEADPPEIRSATTSGAWVSPKMKSMVTFWKLTAAKRTPNAARTTMNQKRAPRPRDVGTPSIGRDPSTAHRWLSE